MDQRKHRRVQGHRLEQNRGISGHYPSTPALKGFGDRPRGTQEERSSYEAPGEAILFGHQTRR